MRVPRLGDTTRVVAVVFLSMVALAARSAEKPRAGGAVVALGGGGDWVVVKDGRVVADVGDGNLSAAARANAGDLVDVAISPGGNWAVVWDGDSDTEGAGGRFNREIRRIQGEGHRVSAVALGSNRSFVIAHDAGYEEVGIPLAMKHRLDQLYASNRRVDAVGLGLGGWTIVSGSDEWTVAQATTTPSFGDAISGILSDGGGVQDVALGEAGWIIARADGGFVARGVPMEACRALTELGPGLACSDVEDAAGLAEGVTPDVPDDALRRKAPDVPSRGGDTPRVDGIEKPGPDVPHDAIRRAAPNVDLSREVSSSIRVVLDIDRVKLGTSSLTTELFDADVYMWKYTCIGRLGDRSVNNVAVAREWGPTDVDVDDFFALGQFGRTAFNLDPQETYAILLVIGEEDLATSDAQRQRALNKIYDEFRDRCSTALERNLRVADDQRVAETVDRMGRIYMDGLEQEAQRIFDRETNAWTDEDEFLGAYADWWIHAHPRAANGVASDHVPTPGAYTPGGTTQWCGAVSPSGIPIMQDWPCIQVDGEIRVRDL